MKKSLLALSICGMLSATAYADPTVTLWGSLDAGIMSSNSPHGGAAGASGSTTSMVEGAMSPSEWGIKASEDLGGGLSATASLTGGLNVTNGTIDNPGGGGLFGREANVSIGSTEWGRIKAGLQYDPAVLASIATEPHGFTDGASNASYWIMSTLGNGPVATFTGGIFDQNALSYTYTGNGLYLGLLYSFGGVSGNSSPNSGSSVGITYTNSGFTVSGSYATYKCAGGASNPFNGGCTAGQTGSIDDGVGLAWAGGPFAIRGQYLEFKYAYNAGGTAAHDVKSAGIGGDWTVGANTVNLAFYSAKDNGPMYGGKTTEVALTDYYKFSKSTKVWVTAINANAGTNAGDSAQISGVLGAGVAYSNSFADGTNGGKSTIFGVGLIKSF